MVNAIHPPLPPASTLVVQYQNKATYTVTVTKQKVKSNCRIRSIYFERYSIALLLLALARVQSQLFFLLVMRLHFY